VDMMEGRLHHIVALSERESPLHPPLLLEVCGKQRNACGGAVDATCTIHPFQYILTVDLRFANRETRPPFSWNIWRVSQDVCLKMCV